MEWLFDELKSAINISSLGFFQKLHPSLSCKSEVACIVDRDAIPAEVVGNDGVVQVEVQILRVFQQPLGPVIIEHPFHMFWFREVHPGLFIVVFLHKRIHEGFP